MTDCLYVGIGKEDWRVTSAMRCIFGSMSQKISKFIAVTLLLFAVGHTFTGASKKYRYHGMKLKQVSIVAPGELFSTYTFTEGEDKMVKAAVKGDESLFEEIVKFHVEDNWPEPLNDFNWRISNGETLKQLVAYKLCDLEADRCVIVVPMEKNKKVKDIVFTRDLYFVIRRTGIK